MKRKGFTLIELLAVIVILAIITVIAVPKILDVIEKSKEQTFKDGVKLIKSGIKLQLSSNDLTGEGNFKKDTDNCYLFDFTNQNENYQKLNVKNKENYEGIIKYCDNKFILEEFTDNKYTITTDLETGEETVEKVGVQVKKYKVIFNVDGGTSIKVQKIQEGEKVTKPDDPTKEGYDFVKWMLGDTEYTFTEEVTEDITLTAIWEKKQAKLCKRAITLHTETCTSSYCIAAGYSSGQAITYGNLGEEGVLTSGDAFDCDVNGDGKYDPETERFYYVSDYYNIEYNEITKKYEDKYDDTYAALIYYNNTTNGVPDNTTKSRTPYGNRAIPTTAELNLPDWSNVELKKQTRVIKDNKGNVVNGGFTYEKSTRLITINEINVACPLAFNWVVGELDNCTFLMENTIFSTPENRVDGYWTENPRGDPGYQDKNYVVYSKDRDVEGGLISGTVYAARPVIDVPKTAIEY